MNPVNPVRRHLTQDNVLTLMMGVITTGWVLTAAVVWRDVLRNRDATRDAEQRTVDEVRRNRAVGVEILRRLPETRPAGR